MPSVDAYWIWYVMEYLFWNRCACQWLCARHTVSFGKGRKSFLSKKSLRMVYIRFQRLTPVHPIFLCLFFIFILKTKFHIFSPLTSAWAGALFVLFCNTAAYSGEIFYGALRAIPKNDIEAADAYGITGWARFRRIIWPTMLRLAWPAYTNEAIFLFHATTLVFFSGFPAWQQRGDALYYANYFADKTFNPFIPYPILAGYFIILTLILIGLFGIANRKLNNHLPKEQHSKIKFKIKLIR